MICDFLEDFSIAIPAGASTDTSSSAVVNEKRAAAEFDKGYKAGWSDAIAESDLRNNIAMENLAQAMQEASFTYFEARNHILNSMRPMIEELAAKVLPDIAISGLAPMIAENLAKLSEELETPITICCAPQSLEKLEAACRGTIAPPVTFLAEPSLNEMQVLFRYADGSAEVDLKKTIDQLTHSIREFYGALDAREDQHVKQL